MISAATLGMAVAGHDQDNNTGMAQLLLRLVQAKMAECYQYILSSLWWKAQLLKRALVQLVAHVSIRLRNRGVTSECSKF